MIRAKEFHFPAPRKHLLHDFVDLSGFARLFADRCKDDIIGDLGRGIHVP